MTPLENELRAALHDLAPDTVDTDGWSETARGRARHARARTVAGVGLVAALFALGAIGLLTRGTQQSTLPVHPRPTTSADTYTALCALDLVETPAPWGDVEPSQRFSVVALCPDDPADPAWAELPRPATLRGASMDGLASSGGPPVENCDLGRPNLPGFHVIARALDGRTTSTASSSQRCGGAQLAQSFAAGLAQQQDDATSTPGQGCAGMLRVDTSDPPRRIDDAASVHICVTADPYTEAEPAPLRYRPVHAFEVPVSDRRAILDGLAAATSTTGKYTGCPWRHAALKIVTTDSAGHRAAVLIRCEQDYTVGGSDGASRITTMRGTWPTLPTPAQQILEHHVAAYLEGRPSQ